MDALAEVEADPEYDSMSRRFWVSAGLSLPVLLIAMLGDALRLPISSVARNWIEFALASPVVLWAAGLFSSVFWASVVNRSPQHVHSDRLGHRCSLSRQRCRHALPANIPSFLSRHARRPLPPTLKPQPSSRLSFCLARCLNCVRGSRQAARFALCLILAPKQAHLIAADGAENDIALDVVKVGDRLRVRPGESVPVDGEIVEGASRRR